MVGVLIVLVEHLTNEQIHDSSTRISMTTKVIHKQGNTVLEEVFIYIWRNPDKI
jgi:hypothetical protein